MRTNLLLRTLALAAALATVVSAPAYETIRSGSALIKWPNGTIPMQIKLGTAKTLLDQTNYSTSAQAAMESWNTVLRNVQFAPTIASEGLGHDRDGINELFFDSKIYSNATGGGDAFDDSTLAVTISYRSSALSTDGTYRRTTSDIIFNTAWKWESYRGARQSSTSVGIDIRRVAVHELGHVLGLDHPDEWGQTSIVPVPVMNSHVSDTDAITRDDIDGAQYIYGVPGNPTAPANDNFANATAVTIPASNTVTLTGSSLSATKEAGEPNHASEAGGASVWWKWTAPFNGPLEVKTAGTPFDTLLGVYTGTAVNSLTLVASNDDAEPPPTSGQDSQTRNRTSIVSFTATQGTTYYFAVDGWSGEWGSNISLTFTFAPVIPDSAPTITTQPQSQSVLAGTGVVFSVVATGKPNPTYQWNKGGAAIAGATGTTLTFANAQVSDSGTYTVTVTNSVGSVTSNSATLTVSAPPTPSGGGGGGGGGAPSHWFCAALALAALARWRQRRQ
ncbi:MAG: immunoglobulin domain-containing protein [Candidatus Didemnitutus sp.]|nr:immunoglobulin domain-containing protein [Candidatus Didemnitutus sp.]